MEENKNVEPDFELCGRCGAVLDKDALFCKRCGVKLEPKTDVDDNKEGSKLCKRCGAKLEGEDVKFCPKCGAAVVAEEQAPVPEKKLCHVCGYELADDDKFCQNCGKPVAPSEVSASDDGASEAAPSKKFCMKCGAEIDDGIKFCYKCGTPVGDVSAVTPQGSSTVAPQNGGAASAVDKSTSKKRMISAILYLVGAFISVLMVFIFACTPFISVSVSMFGMKASAGGQNGLGLIGVMFGGESEIVKMGVSVELLRWAGWLYVALLLAIIDHLVCLCINIVRYQRKERPINLFQSNLAIFIAAVGIFVVGIIARVQIGASFDASVPSEYEYYSPELSCYLGFVGIFVLALIGFVCAAVGFAYSRGIYPPIERKERTHGTALAILLVDIACAVLIALAVIAPIVNMFNYNSDPEIHVSAGESGMAELTCNDESDEFGRNVMVGATVFVLDDIEKDYSYTFKITTDDANADALSTALTLVYYSQVDGTSSAKVYESLYSAQVEWDYFVDYGSDYASVSFDCESYRDLAVVVCFISSNETTVQYEYSLELA